MGKVGGHEVHEKSWVDGVSPYWRDPELDIFRGYLEVISRRLAAVEARLDQESGGTAFVRAYERPEVGGSLGQQVLEPIRLISERLERIEQRLEGGRTPAGDS